MRQDLRVVDLPTLWPVRVSGPRLSLREVTMNDAHAAFAWGSDPEWFRHLPFEPVSTLEQERNFIAAVMAGAQATPRMDYHLAVEVNDTGEMVGLVNLRITSSRHRSAELGFGIARDHWRQGLATAAARLLVDLGFHVLHLHRITAGHHPDNVASRRVIERLGMVREGHLRENLLAHGVWRDSVVYSILDYEWTTSA